MADDKEVPVQTPKMRMRVGLMGSVYFLAQGISLFRYHYILYCPACMGRQKIDPHTEVIWGSIMLIAVPGFLAFAWDGYRKMNRKG